jgi:small subunit ribosomal protein S16
LLRKRTTSPNKRVYALAAGGAKKICLEGPVSAILRCCDVCGRAHLSGPCCAGDLPPFAWRTRRAGEDPAGKSPKNARKAPQPERNRINVVMIRLARIGAPKQPYYRIVVIEKDRARNGRSIEVVGTYNPRTNPATVNLKHERIAYWRSVGATLSPIMQKLVTKNPAVPDTPAPVVSDPTPAPAVTDPAAA